MNKIFRRTASAIFIIMFFIIAMLGILGCFQPWRCGGTNAAAAIAIFAVLFLCGGLLISKYTDNITDKQLDRFYICMAAATLVIQLVVVWNLRVTPNIDSKYVDIAARNFAYDGSYENIYRGLPNKMNYFSRYPNNWAILIFLSYVHRAVYLLTGRLFYMVPRLLAVICIQLSFLFAYLAAKKMIDRKKIAALMTMFMLISPPLYIYSNVFYTDTFVMPFVTGSIFAFTCAHKTDKTRRKVLLLLLTAVLLGLGFVIKGSVAIVAIAVILSSLVFQKPKWTAVLTAFSIAIIIGLNSAVISLGVALGICDRQTLYDYKIPTISWINMSFIDSGDFNPAERGVIAGVQGVDNKKRVLKERMKFHADNYKKDPRSFVDHITLKATQTWGDATFGSRRYLKKSVNEELYSVLVHSKGSIFVMTGIHGCLVILMFCSCIKGFADGGSGGMFIFRMAAAGLVCFLLIWESKSRYTVQFLPIYYLMAADGLNFVLDKLSGSKTANKILNKINSNKVESYSHNES